MTADPPLMDGPGEQEQIADLRARLAEAQETLDAIRYGAVDAVLVKQSGASRIFTLVNADRPYRHLIEQMKEGAVTLSQEGIVLYGNRRLGEILGAPLERIVGTNIKRFFSGDELVKFELLLAGAGPEPSRAELVVRGSGGARLPIYISINDIVSDADAPRLIGGVITDLTAQHEIDACLRQAQKMEAVAQLTGGLAHDFNGLLQVISGNLSLIRLRPGDPADISRWADNCLKATARGARLTAQ